MAKALKIKLLKAAHDELIRMLELDEAYASVRFVYAGGCCKTAKIDIYLDNFKTGDVKTNIGNLEVLYDENLVDKIQELTIAYSDSRFWIKTILQEDSKSHCSSSKKESCGGCSGHCSSH